MSRIIEPFARNEYIYISKQLKIRWSVMYVKYRLKYRQVSNWRFDVWLHPFELFTQAVSYQRSVSTTSLVKSMYWKLCYTTLFQLIYPTRKKVKRRNVYQKVKIRDRLSEKSRVRAGFSGAAIIIIFLL